MVPPKLHNQIFIRCQVICTCQDGLCCELNQGFLVTLSYFEYACSSTASLYIYSTKNLLWQNCSKVYVTICDLPNMVTFEIQEFNLFCGLLHSFPSVPSLVAIFNMQIPKCLHFNNFWNSFSCFCTRVTFQDMEKD